MTMPEKNLAGLTLLLKNDEVKSFYGWTHPSRLNSFKYNNFNIPIAESEFSKYQIIKYRWVNYQSLKPNEDEKKQHWNPST